MTATEFLKDCGTFYLLTVDGDAPKGRPFGAVTEMGGKLYLCTGEHKALFSQLMASPKAELLALKAGTREWIRIDGEIAVSHAKKERMLADCPNLLKHHKTADDPAFCLLEMTVARAEYHAGKEVALLEV